MKISMVQSFHHPFSGAAPIIAFHAPPAAKLPRN